MIDRQNLLLAPCYIHLSICYLLPVTFYLLLATCCFLVATWLVTIVVSIPSLIKAQFISNRSTWLIRQNLQLATCYLLHLSYNLLLSSHCWLLSTVLLLATIVVRRPILTMTNKSQNKWASFPELGSAQPQLVVLLFFWRWGLQGLT